MCLAASRNPWRKLRLLHKRFVGSLLWSGHGGVMRKATLTERLLHTSLRATYLIFAAMTWNAGGRVTALVLQTRKLGRREVERLA